MARPDRSDLKVRVASAAVLLPSTVAAIWMGDWYFAAMMALIAGAMGWEWAALCGGRMALRAAVIATCLAASALTFAGAYREAAGAVALGSLAVAIIARIERSDAPFLLPAGVVYVGLALSSIVWLRLAPQAGLATFLWMVCAVVATDVGAYFAGRALGGPKLAPRISPGKTWSGLAGGVACAAAAGALFGAAAGSGAPVRIAVLSAVLAAVAQSGDLIESAAKRRFGVKDAGNLIPGHGGVLDRFDGFLTVAPATVLMTWIAGGSPLEWQ